MSTATATSEAPRPPDATSRILLEVANLLRTGRHALVTGAVGDTVLLQGAPMGLHDAFESIGRSAFDVVLRINAVDDIDVVHGDDGDISSLGLGLDPGGAPEGVDDPEVPERERRLRSVRSLTGSRRGGDPVAALRRALTQEAVSVLAIVEQADILLQDPAHHQQVDRDRVAGLQLALRGAARVGAFRNTCVMTAGLATAVPSVLLAGSEDLATIEMGTPSRRERAALLDVRIDEMHGAGALSDAERRRAVDQLARLTDGESLRLVDSLAAFSRLGRHDLGRPRALLHLYRFGDRPDYWSHLRSQLGAIRDQLNARVFGQGPAVDAVVAALAAASMGLTLNGDPASSEGRPRGVLWFVGPTGVGKTELAKAIAEVVYGDAEAYTRLDMSTFGQEHAAERLLGAPPGYVGYEHGGELTNAVRRRPNSVILLDEIEKAHPLVLDRFMSIFEDGRVADAQGRVTYFGETIIIATSNVGADELKQLVERKGDSVGHDDVATVSTDAVRRHFDAIARPEIFGRIRGGVVPFDILRTATIDEITARFVRSAGFAHGPVLDLDLASTQAMARAALADPAVRALGGRQVRTALEQELGRLTTWLALAAPADAERVRVTFVGTEMHVEVDDAAPVRVS
jgi:hypothetical protein